MFANAANYFGKKIIRDPVGHYKNGLLYRAIKKKPLGLSFGPGAKDIIQFSTGKRKQTETPNLEQGSKKRKKETVVKSKNMKKYGKKRMGKKLRSAKKAGKKKYGKKLSKRGSNRQRNGGSGSYQVSLLYKKPKGVKESTALSQNWQVTKTVTFGNSAAMGRQEANEITDPPFNRADLIRCYESAGKFYNYGGAAWITSNETIGGGHLAADGGKLFYVKSCEAIYDLTNQGPTTSEITMYFCVPKNTTDNAPDPLGLWDAGYSTNALNNTAKTRTWIGAKPTESKLFNFGWTVFKKLSFKLNPGAEQQINTKFAINRYLDTDYINEYETIKGISIRTLVVTNGVVGDSAKTIASGVISTTPSKICGVCNMVYKGHMGTTFPTSRCVIGTQLTTAAAGVANQIFSIVDASGAIVDPNLNTVYA